MNVIGVREVPLSSLVLPGDMKWRMKSENVASLSRDLGRWGQFLHDPVVRERDGMVIAGRDRLTAAVAAGRESLPVKLVECSDEEAEALEIVENLHRGPRDEAALRKRWLDIEEKLIAAEREGAPKPPHRPTTPRGEAQERLAKRLGVTKEAIRKTDVRQREEEEPETEESTPVPPCIADAGHGVPQTVDARARRCQQLIDEADKLLLALARLVNGMEESGFSGNDAEKAKSEYQRFSYALRGYRPESVCLVCKGAAEKCLTCLGSGFATAARMRESKRDPLRAQLEKAKTPPKPLKVEIDGDIVQVPPADDDEYAF